jgi:hypothetical protein
VQARELSSAVRPPVVDQVAHAVARALDDGRTQLTVRLEPPALGTVRVTLTLSESGEVSAQVNASTDLGHRMLHDALPRLAAALADRGLEVSQLDVSVGGREEGAAPFSDRPDAWEEPASPDRRPDSAATPVAESRPEEQSAIICDTSHHLIDLVA